MYCFKCGNQVPDGAAFCMVCGTKMPVQDQPQQDAPKPEQPTADLPKSDIPEVKPAQPENPVPNAADAAKPELGVPQAGTLEQGTVPAGNPYQNAAQPGNPVPSGPQTGYTAAGAPQAAGPAYNVPQGGYPGQGAAQPYGYGGPSAPPAAAKKKKSKLPIILGALGVLVVLVIVIGVVSSMGGGDIDYKESVRVYTPFAQSKGMSYTCGEVFDQYLENIAWDVQEADGAADVVIRGTAKGTDKEIEVSLHAAGSADKQSVSYSNVVMRFGGSEPSAEWLLALFTACDQKDEDLSALDTLYAEVSFAGGRDNLKGTFSDDAKGFSFRYPDFWVQENASDDLLVSIASPRNGANHRTTVTVGKAEDTFGVLTGDEAAIQAAVNGTDGLSFINVETLGTPGVPLTALAYSETGQNGDDAVITIWFYIDEDVYRFAMRCASADMDLYSSIFDAILTSLNVEPLHYNKHALVENYAPLGETDVDITYGELFRWLLQDQTSSLQQDGTAFTLTYTGTCTGGDFPVELVLKGTVSSDGSASFNVLPDTMTIDGKAISDPQLMLTALFLACRDAETNPTFMAFFDAETARGSDTFADLMETTILIHGVPLEDVMGMRAGDIMSAFGPPGDYKLNLSMSYLDEYGEIDIWFDDNGKITSIDASPEALSYQGETFAQDINQLLALLNCPYDNLGGAGGGSRYAVHWGDIDLWLSYMIFSIDNEFPVQTVMIFPGQGGQGGSTSDEGVIYADMEEEWIPLVDWLGKSIDDFRTVGGIQQMGDCWYQCRGIDICTTPDGTISRFRLDADRCIVDNTRLVFTWDGAIDFLGEPSTQYAQLITVPEVSPQGYYGHLIYSDPDSDILMVVMFIPNDDFAHDVFIEYASYWNADVPHHW